MDLLGNSIEDLFQKQNRDLSPKTILMIGMQMVLINFFKNLKNRSSMK